MATQKATKLTKPKNRPTFKHIAFFVIATGLKISTPLLEMLLGKKTRIAIVTGDDIIAFQNWSMSKRLDSQYLTKFVGKF